MQEHAARRSMVEQVGRGNYGTQIDLKRDRTSQNDSSLKRFEESILPAGQLHVAG